MNAGMGEYWKRIFRLALRRALEVVRLESWERRFVLFITIVVPAVAAWFLIGDHVGAAVRALATLGASAVAVFVIFAWSVVKLPSIMAEEQRQEIERLNAEQETAEKTKQRRQTLGIMLHNANEIAKLYRTETPTTDVIAMADKWKSDMEEFATDHLDEAHQALLWSDSGIMIGQPVDLNSERLGRWLWMTYRAIRIQEIIQSL